MAHQRFVPYMCHGSAVWDGKGRYGMGSDGIRTQQKQGDRRQPPVLLWVFYRSARVRVPPWALTRQASTSRDSIAFALTRCVCSKDCSKRPLPPPASPPEFETLRSSSSWPVRSPMLSLATSSQSAVHGSVV